MKNKCLISLLLLLSFNVFSSVEAEGLTKLSPSKIKALILNKIKQSDEIPTNLVGIDEYGLWCGSAKVESLKILKIGKASSNYYERSGSYIGSYFKVKFAIKGSCVLSKPYRFNKWEVRRAEDKRRKYIRGINNPYDYYPNAPELIDPIDFSGRMPFMNVPFELTISTDDYGDWSPNISSIYPFNYKEDSAYTDKTTAYLKALYYQKNKDTIEKRKLEKAAKKVSDKKEYFARKKALIEENKRKRIKQKRTGSLKQRMAAVKRQMVSPQDHKLYQELVKICVKNKWRVCSGVTPHCYMSKEGKRCPSARTSLSDFENFYVPLVKAQKKYKGKIVKELGYTYKGGFRHESDIKKFKVVFNKLLNQYPDIKRQYESKGRQYRNTFFDYLYYQESAEARKLVLLEFARVMHDG